MGNIEILSEKPITMAELKKEIEKIKKRDKELNFRSAKTDEYLQNFTGLKGAEELVKKLENLKIPRLKDIHIAKIVDISPKTVDELKVVLQGYSVTVNNDNIKKIIDAINSSKPKS